MANCESRVKALAKITTFVPNGQIKTVGVLGVLNAKGNAQHSDAVIHRLGIKRIRFFFLVWRVCVFVCCVLNVIVIPRDRPPSCKEKPRPFGRGFRLSVVVFDSFEEFPDNLLVPVFLVELVALLRAKPCRNLDSLIFEEK